MLNLPRKFLPNLVRHDRQIRTGRESIDPVKAIHMSADLMGIHKTAFRSEDNLPESAKRNDLL